MGLKQITFLTAVIVACLAVPWGQALAGSAPKEGRRPVLTVWQARRLCRKDRGEHRAVWVRGYFVPAVYPPDIIPPAGQAQGQLFASARAGSAGRPGLRVGVGPVTLARYRAGIPPGTVLVRGVLLCAPPLLIAFAYQTGGQPEPEMGDLAPGYCSRYRCSRAVVPGMVISVR